MILKILDLIDLKKIKKNNDGDDDLKKKMNKAWPNAPSLTINVILRSFIARWLLLE